MNILMVTNTFVPHVGGVARSIESFSEHFRQLGHNVKIIAPMFDGTPEHEKNVLRVAAIRNFNHTDFSVSLPIPHYLHDELEQFDPDIVHSHHPFLLGATALRIAHAYKLPLVFTHHTRYEDYTHNIPGDSPALKRFVEALATNYANTCDHVFVPSESMASVIKERGVVRPITVVPTGVDIGHIGSGDKSAFRRTLGIPDTAFIVGHLGRLTKEKNIPFLMRAVAEFIKHADPNLDIRMVIFGDGPVRAEISAFFENQGLGEKLYLAGAVSKDHVADAYHCMNVFVFSSQSETQGMVITEAMAAGLPVVAVDAPGVREVVATGHNGYLLDDCSQTKFVEALLTLSSLPADQMDVLKSNALDTAKNYAMSSTALKAISVYLSLVEYDSGARDDNYAMWTNALGLFEAEWEILTNTFDAVRNAVKTD